MTLQNRDAQIPFTTKDGSTIRSLLDRTNAPVQLQSLAEATLTLGQATERHYHRLSEEIYYLLEGTGEMELDGERQNVRPGDAILIPPGAWHQITGTSAVPLRFLCACSPPYEHGDTYFEQHRASLGVGLPTSEKFPLLKGNLLPILPILLQEKEIQMGTTSVCFTKKTVCEIFKEICFTKNVICLGKNVVCEL